MLEGVADFLAEAGHEVTVICAAGGYAGSYSGMSATAADVDGARIANGIKPATVIDAPLHILRIGATRFGRGTMAGKLLDYASYYLGVAWKLATLHPKPDRIIALTTPPYLSVLARLISKARGADHAHWVMDLYPDVMAAHGMLNEEGVTYRILRTLARWGFGGTRCHAVLTLGPDMAERVEKVISDQSSVISKDKCSGVSATVADVLSCIPDQPSSSEWVPLWGSDEDERNATVTDTPLRAASALRARRGWSDDDLIVMYSGNMGLGHRFGEILAVAKRGTIEHRREEVIGADTEDSALRRMNESRDELPLGQPVGASPSVNLSATAVSGFRDPDLAPAFCNSQLPILRSQLPPKLRFVFYGGGKRRKEIESFLASHPDAPVELHDYAPADGLVAHLQSADVHLVSLDPAWTGTMVPSKLQGIFQAGRPVIFIGSTESSIGQWVRESGGGWVVQPDDTEGLLAALGDAKDPQVRTMRGQAAKAFAAAHFNKRANIARVAGILIGRPLTM